MIRHFFVAVLTCCILCGCQDGDEPATVDVTRLSFTDQIVIGKPVARGDSVILTWSKLDHAKFSRYLIIRKEFDNAFFNPGEDYAAAGIKVISTIPNAAITQYVDKQAPPHPYLAYQIVGCVASGDNAHPFDYIYSGAAAYERPDINVVNTYHLLDVIPDLSRQWLYMIQKDPGRIQIVNYRTLAEVNKLESDVKIGYCALGKYNGADELYVPRSDGWIYIYDPVTLAVRDKINVTYPSFCVVSNGDKLFVSTNQWMNDPLRVYDRATKQLITRTGDFKETRMRLVPGTNTDILEVTTNTMPVDQHYYRFNSAGGIISHNADRYHADYPLHHDAFRFFPDGQKYITGRDGTIYNIDMTYAGRLQGVSHEFSSYEFSQDGSVVYCGCASDKAIRSFSTSTNSAIKSYRTIGYPRRLFREGNSLICVSFAESTDYFYYEYNSYPSRVMVEKIAL